LSGMRAWIVVVLAACGAPPPAPPPAQPPPPPSTRAEAEPWRPAPKPEPPRTERSREQVILDDMPRFRRDPPQELSEKRGDLWKPCVRNLVETRDRNVRNELGDALTFYTTACRDPLRVEFGPPQRRYYQLNSYFGFVGELTPRSARIELLFVRRNAPPPQRITLIAGALRWTSPKFDALLETDVSSTKLLYTKAVARVLRKMLETEDAIVRFESELDSEDMLVTDVIKDDLRVFVDLADSLSP
ncbi:MAG: hypothetical protein H0T46_14765, partial [Deltaproteobacteria bacterium]|nr:hypothetical protein [Deltaproteobacteria bacterium]